MQNLSSGLENFSTREASADEVERIVALINAAAAEGVGTRPITLTQYAQWLVAPHFDPNLDRRLVVTPSGSIVGYGHVLNRLAFTRNNALIYVHPAYNNQGIGTCLTQWAEARVREFMPLAPAGHAVILGCSIPSTHHRARNVLLTQAFRLARHFFELQIELDETPAAPQWLPGFQVRTAHYGTDDLLIYQLIDETFADHWGHVQVPLAQGFERFQHRIRHNPAHDPSLWFLAYTGQAVVGYALCEPSGWINHLGVRRVWRRQGIALALLQHSFAEFWRRDIRTVRLHVDTDSSTGALRLYEKVGMQVARQTDVYQKVLKVKSV